MADDVLLVGASGATLHLDLDHLTYLGVPSWDGPAWPFTRQAA